jgi:hypothetical protein
MKVTIEYEDGTKDFTTFEHLAEEEWQASECRAVRDMMDIHQVPSKATNGKDYSLWGRVLHFRRMNSLLIELYEQLRLIKKLHKTDYNDFDPYWRGVRIGLETAINLEIDREKQLTNGDLV